MNYNKKGFEIIESIEYDEYMFNNTLINKINLMLKTGKGIYVSTVDNRESKTKLDRMFR